MTPHRATQAGSRFEVAELCAPRDRTRLDQLALGFHHRPDRAISTTTVGALSEDDTRLALIIFAGVEY